MPIYEYRCPNCGAEVEKLQKLGDQPPKCSDPRCADRLMEKKVSAANFELKGGGWYRDGYSK